MALQVEDVAIEVVELLRPLVELIGRRDRSLADQVRRAASSVVLNVAEGEGVVGGNKRLRFLTAYGSAGEVRAGLRVAVAWGYVGRERVRAAEEGVERVRRMLYGLCRE
jgi:four helix bundle protein